MRKPTSAITAIRLEELGREWQTRLSLLNWSIDFHLVGQDKIKGCYGRNDHYSDSLRSDISILDPDDNTDGEPGDVKYIPEITIVHELLHLVVNQLNPNKHLQHIVEQTVESLAVALVSAKYGRMNIREFYPFYEEVK